MSLKLIEQLEAKVDLLLQRNRALEESCCALRAEREAWLKEKDSFRCELDRILAKLDSVMPQEETP